MGELWKSIEGFPTHEVSSEGRVRRATASMGTRVGHVLTPYVKSDGYAYVCIQRKVKSVHRLVAKAFLGGCPTGNEVNHKNGLKADNRVSNLEYVTKSENALHAHHVLHARDMKGEKHPRAKLSQEAVAEIRASSERVRVLAARYGVGQSTISMVRTGRNWK